MYLSKIVNSASFINAIIMIVYTFCKDGDGAGVILAVLIGPFLIIPQAILLIISLLKKRNLILNTIFILCGIFTTILTIGIVNFKFNIFVILNIILLVAVFIDLLVIRKKNNIKQ